MATFKTADSEDIALLMEVCREHHKDMIEAGVRFSLLQAYAKVDESTGEVVGCALKLHGQPCLATVKINSVQDRVEGKADATIKLDGDAWPLHTDETRRAILDHELEHLVLVRDEDGNILIDDANRPRLKMRQHDIVIGGFLVRRGSARAARGGGQAVRRYQQGVQPEVFSLGLKAFGLRT